MTASVSFGSSPDYLLSSVGARSDNYYLQAIDQDGEPPGIWAGKGAAAFGLSGEVDPETFREMYTHLIDPRDIDKLHSVTAERWDAYRKAHPDLQRGTDEYKAAKAAIRKEALAEFRLGSPLRDYSKSTQRKVDEAVEKLGEHATPEQKWAAEMGVRRNATQSNTYVDVTFSAPKSWSLLHAGLQVRAVEERLAGNHELADAYAAQAEQVWEALKEGAAAGLAHMEAQAGYTREGRFASKKGEASVGKRVDAHELTAAQFAQHLSRDEDPQLHIHTAILNRVAYKSVDPVTGEEVTKWGALDGKLILREAKAAGHLFEKVAEESLTRRLGVRFEMRPDGKAREIVGIEESLRDLYSSRRRVVTAGVKELADAYEAKHGVAPKAHTLAKMAQFVTLRDRKVKDHDGASREELLERWESAAKENLQTTLRDVPEAVAQAASERGTAPEEFDPAEVVRKAIETVQSERSTWQRSHLQVEIIRQLPDCLGGLDVDQVTSLVNELTDFALTNPEESGLVALAAPELIPMPRSLQLGDGTPIYQVPGAEQYATRGHLDTEERLLEDARLVGGPALTEEQIEQALVGRGLNAGQEAAFRGILGGGRQADVLIGPAGAGKSYVAAAIHDAWRDTGRSVIGLTTSERAARVLAGEGVEHVANLAMFINSNKALAEGKTSPELEKYRLRPDQLVMLDEAGMTETHVMEEVRRLVREAGAKLVYAGDFAQLTSVGAGGMLAELATQAGVQVYELEEVRRFNATWEREASLRLREGDTEVLTDYENRGRLLGGERDEMLTAAYQDWLADTTAGHNSLLIAVSQQQADQLAAMARADLVRLGRVEADGVHLELRGITIGVGDQIQLREINRQVKSATGDRFAVNRDVVQVTQRNKDGSLVVRYDDGELMYLPAHYVQDHVDLAYAGTVHSSQGRTVDRCRVLTEGGDTRESLYVALTRGKDGNWAYVVTERNISELDGPDEVVVDEKFAVLAQAMETSGAELSATAVIRQNLQESVSLVRWSFILDDLQTGYAEERYGRLIHDTLGAERYREISEDPAYGPLIRLARAAEAAGHNPEALLQQSMAGDLSDARHVARVLHSRLEQQIDAADRARVRADERDVRQTVRAQELAAPEVTGAAQLAPVVAERPELVMVYDPQTGGWVQREAEAAPAAAETAGETLPEQPVATWDYEAGQWVQQARVEDGVEVEPEDWLLAPPAPQGLDQAELQPAYGQEAERPRVFDAASGEWVELTIAQEEVPSPWAAVEDAWLEQLTAVNTSIAVLHSGQEEQRRSEIADERRAEAQERARWQSRVAQIPGEKGDTARAAAELMDGRRLLLGQELADAEELPQWAARSLGPVPDVDRPEQREQWIERAGTVAAYREAHGWDSEVAAIGPRPARGAVDYQQDWDQAFRALGEPEERMELVGATDAQLRELVDRYEREEAWAPAHVAPQLRTTHQSIQRLEREEAQRQIALLEATDEAAREELQRQAQAAAEELAELRSRTAALEEIHGVRGDWHEHTEETRERAQEARRLLELREAVEPELELEQFAADEWDMVEPEAEFAPEAEFSPFDDGEWQMTEPEAELEVPADVEAEHDVHQDVAEPVPVEEPELADEFQPYQWESAKPAPEPEPEAELAAPADVEAEHDVHQDVAEAGHQDVADVQPQAGGPSFAEQSETLRRYHEELLLGQAAEEPAAAVSAPQEAVLTAEVEAEPVLAGEGLHDALLQAREARGILDDRAAYQDQVVAEARAAIGELQAGRDAAEAVREVPPPSVPAQPVPVVEAPQIQIQL
ncbi:MobF family relaxase [Streptomyces kaniharaensis]|nr:MobF family relaxase [Streptomyces kaniharaensis]